MKQPICVLMSSDKNGNFDIEIIDSIGLVPNTAEFDNWIEVDGTIYPVYVTIDTQVFGRSFALDLFARSIENGETEWPE